MATAKAMQAKPAAKKTSDKKATSPQAEYMLWTDIEKKYPGYHVLLENPEYKSERDVLPIQATLVGKHKTFKGLVEISKKLNGKRYTFLFTEGVKDAAEPRPMYIF